MLTKPFDVIVVGGALVGASAAVALAEQGLSSTESFEEAPGLLEVGSPVCIIMSEAF